MCHCIFTSDIKGNEIDEDIISELVLSAKKGKYEICVNRKMAIEKAISMANNDDIVLVLVVEYFFEKNRKMY